MKFPPSIVEPRHPDWLILQRIAQSLDSAARGRARLVEKTGVLLRRAADEVIDSGRTQRLTLAETEKTEKTYLGTKVEILFRSAFGLRRGKTLDLLVDGIDVDIKNSMGSSWMIPREAINRPCLLITSDEKSARFSMGLIVCKPGYLTASGNQDKKRQVSATGRCNILWLAQHEPYPQNLWESVGAEEKSAIFMSSGGADRVAALFRMIQDKPIHRDVVASVAQQKDFMKRIRRNGGARDQLDLEGIGVLWGARHNPVARKLNLPPLTRDEFLSHAARSSEERGLMRAFDLLP